jgi:hypothetical protein
VGFNRNHGKNITHGTVAKLTEKFKKMGSVADKPRSDCPRTTADEGATNMVLGAFARSPQKSTQTLVAESSVSRSSIMYILKKHR